MLDLKKKKKLYVSYRLASPLRELLKEALITSLLPTQLLRRNHSRRIELGRFYCRRPCNIY